MRILGADPGRSGALALIDSVAGTLAVEKMPVWDRQLATTSKTMVDEQGMTLLFQRWRPDEVWIEDVWARGGQQGDGHREGATQSFSFGYAKCMLVAVTYAVCGFRAKYVPPAKWKGDLGVSADKMLAKARAHRYFPDCTKLLTSEAKAEAAMIALWGGLSSGAQIGRLRPAE